MGDDLYAKGVAARQKLLGDWFQDKYFEKPNEDFNRDFLKLVTEYCFGAVWGSEGLSNKQRSLNQLCILSALNHPEEFEIHFRLALRNGCTLEEIRDTLIQIMVYVGVPAGARAFKIGQKVLAELDDVSAPA